jgi:hypothetical protein
MTKKSGSNRDQESSDSRSRPSLEEGAALIRAFYRIQGKEVRDAIIAIVTRLPENRSPASLP